MTFKALIKSVVPITWLKKSFLLYNRLRIRTIDRILFPEFPVAENEYTLRADHTVYDDLAIREDHLDPDVRPRLAMWHGWTQDQYILVFRRACVIEPEYGWALAGGKLVYPSLGFSRAPYLPKPNFTALHVGTKNNVYVPAAISLRDTGEENYFHFYNDVLAKLCMLDEALLLPPDIPVIISESLYEKPFFQYYLANSSLVQSRNWLVQKKSDYIYSQTTYFCKPLTHTKRYIDRIVASLPLNAPEESGVHKLFLYRNPKRLRYIANIEAVAAICLKHGFTVVDLDEKEPAEQIRLFRPADVIVGIHGAGLTNMIYCGREKVRIVEIFPPENYAPFHYIMLAALFGFDYQAILGKKGTHTRHGGFDVDLPLLERILASGGN